MTWGTTVMARAATHPVKVREDVLVRVAVTSPRRLELEFAKVGKSLR